jgi:hypothetical protein
MRLFGIKIGLNCVCYSKNVPHKKVQNKKSKKNNINSMLRSGDNANLNIHTPLSQALNDISKALCRDKLPILSRQNKTRLDNLIYYTQNKFGSSHSKEYKLMRDFLKLHRDIYLLAVEYEFDEGGSIRQQHGDLILCDGTTIYITECKCIEDDRVYANDRKVNVNEQALRCHMRFESWLDHLVKFDSTKECIRRMNIVPCVITNQNSDKIVISTKN